MRRNSRFFGLEYFVQCCWPGNSHFETIAVFDHDRPAISYAKETLARQMMPGWRYRVVKFRNHEPTCIWRSNDRTEAENKLIHDTIIR